ncbi:MAG: hypothetical protein J6C81_02120 [Muribaculaceae bacterium]|nr:hypothetical protein [Muribaculaceae bacterium]
MEKSLGCRLSSPSDFDFLRQKVFERINVLVSASTIKRLWGYVSTDVIPRKSTLSVFARFLGYIDFDHYCTSVQSAYEQIQSYPVMTGRIEVDKDLRENDCVRILWQPGRVMDVKYLGSGRFRIIHAEKTRLAVGDCFACHLIIDGEPMYLYHETLRSIYVCGKTSGVITQRLND